MTSVAPGSTARMASRICLRRLLASGANDAKYARNFSSACLASFLDDEGGFISLPREDTHVVDQHCRREDRVRLRISIEMPADSQIDDQKKWLVEHRISIHLQCITRHRVMGDIVDSEHARSPQDSSH